MKKRIYLFFLTSLMLTACTQTLPVAESIGEIPSLFPDYMNVTIPPNIAPLNFRLNHAGSAIAVFSFKNETLKVKTTNGSFKIPLKTWNHLLKQAAGDSLQVTIYEKKQQVWFCYEPFSIHIAKEPIDSYLVYRRIAPGYRMWNEMGIYQRNLETFREETILNNKQTDNNCMNCHSFCMQSPDRLLFHQRSGHAGTYIATKNNIYRLQPETVGSGTVRHKKSEKTPPLVYPYWHPSGNFIAFSSNDTKQDFHLSDPNRIEVFDNASDIYLYDLNTGELISSPILCSDENMETFPSFSPDGKYLYFCSSPSKPMPESYKEIKYNLIRVAFNPDTQVFGPETDTLYNAGQNGRSAKFPRISPDGRYLMYTLSDYGNFSIWHKDADLYLLDLETLGTDSLPHVNSRNVDSYHSWSSNSRWFVFSSRRMDGLYTHPYICYIDKHGKTGKPFLLPQKETDYYTRSLFSFNIPELVNGKVDISSYDLMRFTLEQ